MEESQKDAIQLSGVCRRSVVDVYRSIRGMCSKYFERYPIQLGGPSRGCQIDESQFVHKVKHHRGRAPQSDVWVFGITDIATQPSVGYMTIVGDRSASTLLPIIQNVVRAGSIIHGDQWRGYYNLQRDSGLVHSTVNHSLHFVDPSTGVHTQNIESYWNKHKSRIKAMKGVCRNMLQSYLNEYMWRDRFQTTAFASICTHIVSQYH